MAAERSFVARVREFFSWRVLLAVVFWGVSFPYTKAALQSFHPNGLIAARMWIGAALLALLALVRREPLFPERRDRARCVVLGVILGVHLLMQAFALRYTSSISSGWIIAFNPVVLALGGQLLLGERVRSVGWLGIAVATGGLVWITLARGAAFDHASFGDLLILASCFTWPLFTVLSAKPTASSGALRVTTAAMLVAGVLNTVAACASGWLVAPLTWKAGFSVAFLGVACNAISFALWMRALDLEGAAKISAMLYFQPFVTMLWSAWIEGESITTATALGGPFVLLGVWLLRRGSPQHVPDRSTGDVPGSASVSN